MDNNQLLDIIRRLESLSSEVLDIKSTVENEYYEKLEVQSEIESLLKYERDIRRLRRLSTHIESALILLGELRYE